LRPLAAALTMLTMVVWAAPSQALDKVKISAFQGAFVALPLYVAQAYKLFEKHGIEAELIYGTGIQVTNILVGGSSDFGAFAIEHGITIAGKGQDVKLLVVNQSATPYGIIVRNDVPTPNKDKPYPEMLKDLKGLKIGITTVGAGTDTALRFLLKQVGLTPNDVKIVPVGGQAQQVAGIKNGLIDAAIAVEPAQSEAVNGMKIAKMILDVEGGQGPAMFTDYAYNGVWTTGAWLKKNPDKAKAIVAAIVDAETMINDPAHFDEVVKVAEDSMRGFDPVLLKAYIQKYHQIYQPVATPAQIANVEKFLKESDVLKDTIPYEKVVATDLMPKEFKVPGAAAK
jgi:NitT/TauT family transport system substrate-binding protein